MFGRLRTSRLWQVMLVLVLAGSAYGVYGWVSGGSGSAETASTRTVTVQYGSIVNSVSTSGSLVFPRTERLTFGFEGTVAGINAEVGDTVAAGQVLAKLDSASLASLESAVLQAEIAMVRAEDRLENPYSELDMAKAELAVVNARIAVETAYDNMKRAIWNGSRRTMSWKSLMLPETKQRRLWLRCREAAIPWKWS